MGVITVSRQLGSWGSLIAQGVAERMGYRIVWRDLINQAAQRSGAPEVALAAIDDLGLLGLHPSPEALAAYHQAVAQVMEEMAAAGDAVIVGRAGQAILRERPGVFHVRIIAPAPLRSARIAERHGVSLAAAAAQVAASDRARRSYLRRHYQIDWNDPELYDLIVNTKRITPDTAISAICSLVPAPEPHLD